MRRSIASTLHHALAVGAGRAPRGWHPLLAVYYLTYRCRFRCPYCSDGAGEPYHAQRCADLGGDAVLELLARIRRHCDNLVITGGEPLEHADVGRVLDGLAPVGFDQVVLTTNGAELAAYLPAVARSVDHLVFSIDTLDHARADRWFGAGPGMLARILAGIDQAARVSGARYRIAISAVATPENLDDLHGVYDYCRERGYLFAVCPQLCGVKAHPELVGHPAYQALFDRLIADKKRGALINGSPLYLEYMRDLKPFDCRPSTLLAVAPAGDVFYPCLEQGQIAGNLLRTADLQRLRQEGIRRHGPEPACDNRCHSACALGFGLALARPASLLPELLSAVRRRLRPAAGRP